MTITLPYVAESQARHKTPILCLASNLFPRGICRAVSAFRPSMSCTYSLLVGGFFWQLGQHDWIDKNLNVDILLPLFQVGFISNPPMPPSAAQPRLRTTSQASMEVRRIKLQIQPFPSFLELPEKAGSYGSEQYGACSGSSWFDVEEITWCM